VRAALRCTFSFFSRLRWLFHASRFALFTIVLLIDPCSKQS
jgi:hypothetical protein